jgi:dsDNA-specific endonuclease/ATPase MutS2
MRQATLFDRRVENRFPDGTQNHRLLNALMDGPKTTADILNLNPRIAKYTNRISEIRRSLEAQGYSLVCEPMAPRNNVYRIVGGAL